MADHITIDADEARAIIENWLTKAYPRTWQREYVTNGIIGDLKNASNPSELQLQQRLYAKTQLLTEALDVIDELTDEVESLESELDEVYDYYAI